MKFVDTSLPCIIDREKGGKGQAGKLSDDNFGKRNFIISMQKISAPSFHLLKE